MLSYLHFYLLRLIYIYYIYIYIYIYICCWSRIPISEFSASPVFVHTCCRLTPIRSPQTSNGRTGNFGPKPCNPWFWRGWSRRQSSLIFRGNELISDSQHGFLPGRSWTTNLLLYVDSLTQARDDGLSSDTIFFDFVKAFDRVPHKPLLHKLQAYGVCGKLLQWINSFLIDIFLREGRSNAVTPCSCLLRCSSRLRSRTTSLSGLHKRPSVCNLKVVLFFMLMTSKFGRLTIQTRFKKDITGQSRGIFPSTTPRALMCPLEAPRSNGFSSSTIVPR